MKPNIIISILAGLTLLSCENVTEPIEYGSDDCHWCQMRIMDPKFGSEAVTDKGRVYKFDSAECLLHYLNDNSAQHSHLVVTDYTKEQTFIDAPTAWFLISEKMPSPMGGFLNAFASESQANLIKSEVGGELLNWDELRAKYQTK